MRRILRRGVGVGVAILGLLGLGALSRAPYTADPSAHGVLRLAWRARGERVQECRRLSAAELERLPPHMRQAERCEGRILPYRLRVSVDDGGVVDAVIRAAGARHDRPLYVYHELALAPGAHRLAVTFESEGAPAAHAGQEGKAGADEHEEDEERTPRRLALDTTVTLAARHVLLVTYDDDERRLVVRSALAGEAHRER